MMTNSNASQVSVFNELLGGKGTTRGHLSKTILTLATGLALASCGNNQQVGTEANTDSSDNAAVSHDEVLRIGTEGAYPPFNYTNADGSLGGFDVEMANALCADMKVTCEIIAQDWDGIIPGLKAGKYDAIVAAMSITPERAEQVSFTDPYFSNNLVFLAKQGSNFDPSNAEDIDKNLIAAQRSTISSQWLEKAYPQAKMKLYDTLSNAFLDLGSDRVDAMISDKLPALQWLNSTSGKNYVLKGDEIDINDNFAIAVRPGDELQAKLNKALANIKANGVYDDLNKRYFSVPAATSAVGGEPATAATAAAAKPEVSTADSKAQ